MRALNSSSFWWGGHQSTEPLSVLQLVEDGNLSTRLAALLWLAMERSASIIVACGPPMAGKTTTLTSLFAFIPQEAQGYFTRGIGEPFDLPPLDPKLPTYILVNELSDHLPVYTWGRYALRAFELLGEGYSLGATMHADSVEEIIDLLEVELGIPSSQVGHLTLMVFLYISRSRPYVRRVQQVVLIQRNEGNNEFHVLSRWDESDDAFRVLESTEARTAFSHWAQLSEEALDQQLQARDAFLAALLERGVRENAEVNEAIANFR